MEQRIIEAAIRRRQPLPDVIANAPELLLGLDTYYEAFVELSTCRNDLGPIPWTAVDRYAERHYFEGESFLYLLKMIRAMDDVFIKYMRAKLDKDRENGTTSNGGA